MMASTEKFMIPKQHGAWAMLIIPFLLGAYAGGFSWIHIPLFLGWLLLYLATYPLLMFFKLRRKTIYLKWFYRYFSIAIILLIIPLMFHFEVIYFGVIMIPFFLINLYYAKKKKERAFINDVAAILSFCIGGIASFYLGRGELTEEAFILSIFCLLFFVGSTFYVKTMIREKKNPLYKWLSWGYHLLLVIGLIILGFPALAIAYGPSVLRAFYFYGKTMSIMKVGIFESINALYFLIMMFFLI